MRPFPLECRLRPNQQEMQSSTKLGDTAAENFKSLARYEFIDSKELAARCSPELEDWAERRIVSSSNESWSQSQRNTT